LTSAGSPAAAKSALNHAADFFSASGYSAWVRGTIRATQDYPDPAILYGSSISEPTDELVRHVREAFSESLTSRYISVFSDGNRYVASAICARYGVKPEELITTTGVTSALSMIVRALTRPGDQVLVEQPGFDLLTSIVRDSGASVEYLQRWQPDFKVDLNALARRLTKSTRLAIITNLHNPSGMHLTPDEIQAIAKVLANVGAVLVVDEVYADFMRPRYCAPAATLAPNIVSTNSLTKVFGLHALKCGWMIGAPELLERIQSESSDGDLGISKLSHAVAAHVMESAAAFDARWQKILVATRPVMNRHIRAMTTEGLVAGDLPEFGCMYFPKIVGVTDTLGLARALWRQHGILVAPGEYFAMPGHVRIGFGGDEIELDKGMTRLHRALRERRD
jgi:hypothetical protein